MGLGLELGPGGWGASKDGRFEERGFVIIRILSYVLYYIGLLSDELVGAEENVGEFILIRFIYTKKLICM